MTYVKSFIVGMAAVVASVCAIVAIEVATVYFTDLRRAGSAGIGAVSVGISVWWLVIPAAAFVGGFGWEFRRASRQSRTRRKG